MTLRPCIECGEPTDGSRCPEHTRNWRPKVSAASRGYDAAWHRLSAKARKLQPFCSDCGATEDLQCDHSPQAWARKAAGKAIRLRDVDVVCGRCNRRRGAARPANIAGMSANTPVRPTRGYTPPQTPKDSGFKARSALHTAHGAHRQPSSKLFSEPVAT